MGEQGFFYSFVLFSFGEKALNDTMNELSYL